MCRTPGISTENHSMLMNDTQSSLTEDELEKAIRSLKDKVDEMKNDLKGEIEVRLKEHRVWGIVSLVALSSMALICHHRNGYTH